VNGTYSCTRVVPRKVQLYILCICIETDRHSFFGMFGDDIFSSTKGAQGPGIYLNGGQIPL
jgi:hypothetical protein